MAFELLVMIFISFRMACLECGKTPSLPYTVCNRCAYDLRTVAMQISSIADKTEGLLFVDASNALNREVAIRNIHAKPAT